MSFLFLFHFFGQNDESNVMRIEGNLEELKKNVYAYDIYVHSL